MGFLAVIVPSETNCLSFQAFRCPTIVTGAFSLPQDINECVEHDCDQGECQNTQGSFRCDCFSGYAMNAEKVCVGMCRAFFFCFET